MQDWQPSEHDIQYTKLLIIIGYVLVLHEFLQIPFALVKFGMHLIQILASLHNSQFNGQSQHLSYPSSKI